MGRLRRRPRTPPTGEAPTVWKPKTPMIPDADIPEGQNPVQPEPPTKGIPVEQEIPSEPGRPRAAIPAEPGTPETEKQRTPRVRTQQQK